MRTVPSLSTAAIANSARTGNALFLASLLLISAPGFAQSHNSHGAHGASASAPASEKQAALADGEVKKVDKESGKITLSHGPLPNLGMPAMTMVFRVKDAAWLDAFKPGMKIRFQAETLDGALTIVRYEPAR